MTNIACIQEQLKKFEKNKNSKEGIEHLQTALEEIAVLEESGDKEEVRFAQNALRKYRNIVIEMAKKACSNGTPSSAELILLVDLVASFRGPNFEEDTDCTGVFAKTFVLYIEAFKRESGAVKLDDSLKTEIYNSIQENSRLTCKKTKNNSTLLI